MANKPNKLTLEKLTEDQQVFLQGQLPKGYLLWQYINDLDKLHGEIDSLIVDGRNLVKQEQYDIAGSTFSDVSDLQEVYKSLARGQLSQAVNIVDKLDTAVRDYIPPRLYDKLHEV